MNTAELLANLLSPPILCFALGLLAVALRSDLELPAPLTKTLSLGLLFMIGLKGGFSLSQSGLSLEVAKGLSAALAASVIVPVWTFFALRGRLGVNDAAGVAATYGSVSAVTFITACSFLALRDIPCSGHMVAAMALMESPAIVLGVFFARHYAKRSEGGGPVDWSHLAKDAFLNGSVFLLLGSLMIGMLTGDGQGATLKPFINTLFPGMLCLFLLDLGMVAARRMGGLRAVGGTALAFGLVAPLINAALGLGLAALAGLNEGDSLLLVVLCASASYIAVPAALRTALPEANPGLYVSLSLAITFPFNIIFGIPLYHWAVLML